MTLRIKCLLGRHNWVTIIHGVHGLIRKCDRCGAIEVSSTLRS